MTLRSLLATATLAVLGLLSCSSTRAGAPGLAGPPQGGFAHKLCTEAPVELRLPPGGRPTRGCVVTFTQSVSDPMIIDELGTDHVERRYLLYAPPQAKTQPSPVVFVFPGRSSSAESVAVYSTHTRFEELADRDGFIVVYGNGLPDPDSDRDVATLPKAGFLRACFAAHTDEGLDVAYVRTIIEQLQTELAVDRTRIYATGLSAGGGMAFELALEAPDLVAAIAPVVPVPFQPSGPWLQRCHPRPGYEHVSIAMLAATHDRFVPYGPGPSAEFPRSRHPGMEQTRDAWLAALGITGTPTIEPFPDEVQGDSYEPHTHMPSSTIERQRYPVGAGGQELWYYKATGMGHGWPSRSQTWSRLWERFGKTNQDVEFADEVWAFFQRHRKNQ